MGDQRGKGRGGGLGSLARALAVASVLASAGRAQEGARGELERALSEPCAPAELRRRLFGLDVSELPRLFAFAVEGHLPGAGPDDDALRAESRRELVREVLAARPRRELVPFLEDLAGRPAETGVRLEALRLLGAIGCGDHLKLLARLAVAPQERGALAPELREAFTSALGAILVRDPAALSQMAALFSESSPCLASSIVEALAGLRAPQATRVLAGLLGRVPGLDPLLLVRLAERGRMHAAGDESVFDAVRRYLKQRDPALVCAAARACGRLGDDGAVEALVGLMDHSDARVKASAFQALADITGLGFGTDAARWTSWYHAEMRWWDGEAESLLAGIERGRGLEFVRAAREVLEHRLYRDRIAESFTQALTRKNADEVRLACRALEQLRSTQAIAGLVECLERDDPAVREAAWHALRAITGVELPPERDSWAQLAG